MRVNRRRSTLDCCSFLRRRLDTAFMKRAGWQEIAICGFTLAQNLITTACSLVEAYLFYHGSQTILEAKWRTKKETRSPTWPRMVRALVRVGDPFRVEDQMSERDSVDWEEKARYISSHRRSWWLNIVVGDGWRVKWERRRRSKEGSAEVYPSPGSVGTHPTQVLRTLQI